MKVLGNRPRQIGPPRRFGSELGPSLFLRPNLPFLANLALADLGRSRLGPSELSLGKLRPEKTIAYYTIV